MEEKEVINSRSYGQAMLSSATDTVARAKVLWGGMLTTSLLLDLFECFNVGKHCLLAGCLLIFIRLR